MSDSEKSIPEQVGDTSRADASPHRALPSERQVKAPSPGNDDWCLS